MVALSKSYRDMARGLTPIFSMAQVESFIGRFTEEAEDKMLETLKYTGEYFVKLARENGAYNDVTGNLRSSIGYVVIQDGDIIQGNFENTGSGPDGEKGVREAKRLAQELALTHNKGLVLIGLAGMDYALKVEQVHGKDVIASSQAAAEQMLKTILKAA